MAKIVGYIATSLDGFITDETSRPSGQHRLRRAVAELRRVSSIRA